MGILLASNCRNAENNTSGLDIPSLLHLGCAKIATLIKQLDQKEINRIIEEEEQYRRAITNGDDVDGSTADVDQGDANISDVDDEDKVDKADDVNALQSIDDLQINCLEYSVSL